MHEVVSRKPAFQKDDLHTAKGFLAPFCAQKLQIWTSKLPTLNVGEMAFKPVGGLSSRQLAQAGRVTPRCRLGPSAASRATVIRLAQPHGIRPINCVGDFSQVIKSAWEFGQYL